MTCNNNAIAKKRDTDRTHRSLLLLKWSAHREDQQLPLESSGTYIEPWSGDESFVYICISKETKNKMVLNLGVFMANLPSSGSTALKIDNTDTEL